MRRHALTISENRAAGEKYLGWVADGSVGDGYAVDEYAALLFRDGQFVEALAERPNRPAFRVQPRWRAPCGRDRDPGAQAVVNVRGVLL